MGFFLEENVNYYNSDNFNEEEIIDKFNKFVIEIKRILCKKEDFEKFNNPFIKMQEGLSSFHYSLKLLDYLRIDDNRKRFYFGQPYISCAVSINNQQLPFNKEFFNKILNDLKESKYRINLLIEKSIKPFLNSFEQWSNLIKKGINKSDEFFNDIERPFIYQDYENSELFIQYNNIKTILIKISERIELNINFLENNKKRLLTDKYSELFVIQEILEEGLELDENLFKEIDFFSDITFHYAYKFSILSKLEQIKTIFWIFNIIGNIAFYVGFCLNPIIGGIIGLGITVGNIIIMKLGYDKYKDVEITEDTIFANILKLVIRAFSGKQSNNQIHLRHKDYNIEINNEFNNDLHIRSIEALNYKIFENIENKFKIIEELDIIKFLLFVDSYLSEEIWQKNIKEIFNKNFKKIYENKICERKSEFKKIITENNFKEILNKYNEVFEEFLNECYNEIKKLGNKKKYDEKTGINCLEHLFIYINSENLTEEIANETVRQMLKYKLITEDGIINKKLFEDCFNKKDIIFGNSKLKQLFNININTRLENKNEIIEINQLKFFNITGFEIPMVDPFFYDLKKFYINHNYNVQKQLEKDYTLYIVNTFKDIIQKMLLMNKGSFDLFYESSLNLVKNLIKNLLEEKFLTKYEQKSLEKEISENLTNEEKLEFKRMIESAGDKTFKALMDK